MLDYIAMFPNEHEKDLNMDFINSAFDPPLDDWVIMAMRDLESVENIELLKCEIVNDQDEVDINNHMININYKKKGLDTIEVPKYRYMLKSRYHEIDFTYRIFTNLHEKIIMKRILVPTEINGQYLINGKDMKGIWQLVDASTYSRRGQTTMKSRMPIMVYRTKRRIITDVDGIEYVVPVYSYAQDSSRRKRPGVAAAKKKQIKFINPLLIFCAKMGFQHTVEFWGMKDIVSIGKSYKEKEKDDVCIFPCNEVYIKVRKDIFMNEELVQSFVGMVINLQNRDFPVTMNQMEDRMYWISRVGYIGSAKNKNLYSFLDKGKTSCHMIERLVDEPAKLSLRLPEIYKKDVYRVMYWMVSEFANLKKRVNIDMAGKRIRKNEVIVFSSLGKKISENIHKLIERKNKSKMNTMETLLELFNFNSDIIMSSMRNMNDIIKFDDRPNDMAFLNNYAYTAKG